MGSQEPNEETGATEDDIQGVEGLIQDLNELLLSVSTTGDLTFTLKRQETIRAHSVIIKARCKSFKGETKYPTVTPDVFNTFLYYVYTGKLKQNWTNYVYNLYLLSMDFGIHSLSSTCENFMLKYLDQNSALKILKEAVETLEKVKESEKVQRIIDTCITHLSENYGNLSTNREFLALPVDCVLTILDSEHFCIEEEQVWRCVLRWAQYKASVTTSVTQWSEEERVKVSHYLTPVISHVRLLLIDSRVFAEEVEPTGCVPMALSLERYRYAALSNFDQSLDDPRLTPRNAQKLFHSSLIINNERVALGKKLQEWILNSNNNEGGNIVSSAGSSSSSHWKCIYRASLHGFSAEDFHRKVDGVGPTCIVIQIANSKSICGGYTDVSWTSSKPPKYIISSNSFLFAFCPESGGRKFNVTKKHFAVCHDANSGPIFGAGADLYISSMCQNNSDSYSNLPHSYELDSTDLNPAGGQQDPNELLLTPSYNFAVADYEVFTLI